MAENIKFSNTTASMQLAEQAGAAIAAEPGMVRVDATETGALRVTDDTGATTVFDASFAAELPDLQADVDALELVVAGHTSDIAAVVGVNNTQTTNISSVTANLAGLIAGTVSFSSLNVGAAGTALTVASNAISISRDHHSIDNSGAAQTVTTINKSSPAASEGDVLLLRATSGAHLVTITNAGNIVTKSGWDSGLKGADQYLLLVYNGTKWVQVNSDPLSVANHVDVPEYGVSYKTPRGLRFPQGVLSEDGSATPLVEVMPSFLARTWFGARSAAATVQPIGMAAPTIVGTPTALVPNFGTGVGVLTPITNIASAATAGLAASVSTATYNLTDALYDPEFTCVIETRGAADILAVRAWIGLFSAIPTNAADQTTRNISFRYDVAAGDANWKCIVDDGTTQTIADSGVLVSANQTYVFRIRLGTSAYYSVNGSAEVVMATGFTGSHQFGAAMSWITTAAAVKNVGFGRMMVTMN